MRPAVPAAVPCSRLKPRGRQPAAGRSAGLRHAGPLVSGPAAFFRGLRRCARARQRARRCARAAGRRWVSVMEPLPHFRAVAPSPHPLRCPSAVPAPALRCLAEPAPPPRRCRGALRNGGPLPALGGSPSGGGTDGPPQQRDHVCIFKVC